MTLIADAIYRHASMVTSEISQVPFTGVLEILKLGRLLALFVFVFFFSCSALFSIVFLLLHREAGVMTILDLDIPPSVCFAMKCITHFRSKQF